jgi:hypothetical protein
VVVGAGLIKAFHTFPTFAYFMESLLKTTGAADSSVLMLPLAFSIGALANLYLHWRSFSKDFPGFTASVRGSAFKSFGASVIGGYSAYLALQYFDDVFDLATAHGVFLQGLCAGLIGMLAMAIVLAAMKSGELRDIAATLRQKIWKVDRASLDRTVS